MEFDVDSFVLGIVATSVVYAIMMLISAQNGLGVLIFLR